MRFDPAPRVVVACVAALFAFAVVPMAGCAGRDGVHTTTKGAVDATGTVQAGSSGDAGGDLGTTPSNGKPWPRKVAIFSQDSGLPAWYPAYLPAGFDIETIDVVELDQGAGLVCDILFLNGDKAVTFVQGSPTNRRYAVDSAEKTPWGDQTAAVVRIDPSDPASPSMIVFEKDGTFVELGGDIPLDELKKMAASMKAVE